MIVFYNVNVCTKIILSGWVIARNKTARTAKTNVGCKTNGYCRSDIYMSHVHLNHESHAPPKEQPKKQARLPAGRSVLTPKITDSPIAEFRPLVGAGHTSPVTQDWTAIGACFCRELYC